MNTTAAAADIVALLGTVGTFAELADNVDYLSVCADEDRMASFAEAMLPDPALVRAWWADQKQIPTNDPNYRKWLDLGILKHVGIPESHSFTGTLLIEMVRLEHLIRMELAPEEDPAFEDELPKVGTEATDEALPAADAEEPTKV